MQDGLTLIKAKLQTPTPRKHYIRRRHLFAKLKNSADYKVVIVQGVAGSGKSTLIASYIQENANVGWQWITLDKNNNHPFSFWYYVLEAINNRFGEQQHLFSMFEAMMRKQDVHNIVTALVNELDSEEPLTLVLDDFHHIDDPDLLESIQLFLKYSPPSVQLFLLTRTEPELYVGDLMIAGKVLEITEADLRLTNEEAQAFLGTTLQMDLDEEVIKRVTRLAEGWAGGLQLLAIALTHNQNKLIGTFKGLNKHVIDYLSNEILSAVSDEERQFLIHTSVLDYFNPTLCNQLLKRKDSKQIIERLLEKNLFLVTIDETTEMYRYHHLFSEFLRLKLSKIDQNVKISCHLRAAELYEQYGDLEESIKHLLTIDHYADAMRLISQIKQTVTAWTFLKQIPLEHVTASKEMVFHRLFYHIGNMELDECQTVLDQLDRATEGDSSWRVFDFFRLLIEDNPIQWEDMTPLQEIDHMQFGEVTKAIIYLTTSMFLSFRDQYREALECVEKVRKMEGHLDNPYISYFALSQTCQIKEALGELSECEVLYQKLFQLLEQCPFLASLLGNSYIGAVGICLKRMELEEAGRYLQKAADNLDKQHPTIERGYLHNLMEFHLLKGEKQHANKLLNYMETAFPIFQTSIYSAVLLKYQFHLGHVESHVLEHFIDIYREHASTRHVRYDAKLVYARAIFVKGNHSGALQTVDDVLEQTRKRTIKMPFIEALLQKIVLLDGLGTAPEKGSLNLLQEALHYSLDNRILSPFVLEGKTLIPYMRRLIEVKGQDLGSRKKRLAQELLTLMERKQTTKLLSERETEVLQVMVDGATNKEIGETLCISVATVKTHIINIYSKLHVSNRVEAIERARELGILGK